MLGTDRIIEERETELDRSLVGERRAAAADILQRRHITFIYDATYGSRVSEGKHCCAEGGGNRMGMA
jgi:hypothetical protein